MMLSLQATRGEGVSNSEGNWTEYLKAFGGKLYRPDVAPAEADEPVDEEPQHRLEDQNRAPNGNAERPVATQPVMPSAGGVPASPPLNLKISTPLFETIPTRKK